MKYEVYFSLFGKHMKTTVTAKSEEEAFEIVKGKIVFHRDKTRRIDDSVDYLMGIFGMKR